MNYLAHLLLSCNDPEAMVGNFLADFIKNQALSSYPVGVQAGVVLHRQIDTYTDTHPVVRIATRRLRARHSHYAPVCIDIFFDYLLCQNWSAYATQPLPVFTREVYTILEQALPIMPAPVARQTTAMIAADWLPSYGTYAGINHTFSRLQQRVSRPHLLDHALETLQQEETRLQKEFNTFFPDVIHYVNELCGC